MGASRRRDRQRLQVGRRGRLPDPDEPPGPRVPRGRVALDIDGGRDDRDGGSVARRQVPEVRVAGHDEVRRRAEAGEPRRAPAAAARALGGRPEGQRVVHVEAEPPRAAPQPLHLAGPEQDAREHDEVVGRERGEEGRAVARAAGERAHLEGHPLQAQRRAELAHPVPRARPLGVVRERQDAEWPHAAPAPSAGRRATTHTESAKSLPR